MKFRREAIVSSAVVAACMGATELRAQAPTGTVTGRVVAAASAAAAQAAAANAGRTASQGATASQATAAQSPLAGARVSVVGTTLQTLVRDDGRFVLPRVPAGTQRIRVNLVGYAPSEQTVTVAAGQPTTVNFSLNATAVALSQVVVVGYGTQRRADLTGSVASVQSTQLQQTTVNTLEQGLQGRVAGVQVTQGDAAPGGGMRVQIRGTNSMNPGSAQPLYVIDGVPIGTAGSDKTLGGTSDPSLSSLTQTNPLAQIAPEDIESIDILKDASATAIYGSRGANGVVIITTKRGTRGAPGQYTLNLSQGTSGVVRQIPVLNAYEFASYVNTAYINAYGPTVQYPYGGRTGSMTPDSIRKVMGAGVNWQDQIFRNAPITDGNIGASGGDERGSYAVNGNLLQQQGVVNGSEFRRGGLRLNLDRNVTERFRLSTNVNFTRSINNMVRSSTINGYNAIGIIREAVTYTPMWTRDTTKADPLAEDATTLSNFGSNPLRYTSQVQENDQVTRGIGGVRGVLTLGKGFSFDENLATNYEAQTYGAYFPSTVNEGRTSNGDAIARGSNFGNLLSESLVRYNGDIGRNQHLEALGGFTFQNDRSTWNLQEVQGFPNDLLGANVLQNGTLPLTPQTGVYTAQLASWLGRVNYNLLGRYLLTGTVRADGSSKFAQNNKWATFPAIAFAWRTIDEPLLRNQSLFSDLKVRLSYGKSGNQAIGAYQSLPAIGSTAFTLNETTQPAYVVTQLGNPNLRWETTSQFDGGVDFGAFANRLTGTIDYYHKNTYDLLQQITLAQNTGFSTAWINSGNVTNKGVEFQLGYDVLRSRSKGGLTWNVSANAAHNTNRIVSLGNGIKQQFASRLGAGGNLEAAPFIQKPGLAIGAMWGYQTAGIVQNAADSASYAKILGSAARVGDLKYADINGDGKITDADQKQIGDANPKWTWGVTNSVRFGKFDASALVIAVKGNSIINAERMRYMTLNGSINIPSYYLQNSFNPTTNPNGIFPEVRQDRQADARFSDIYIEDGSFVRLKNVQVGYNVSLPRMRTARVYVNGINLLTHTRYTGFDPEVSAFGGPDRPGVDLGSYPQQRTFTFGINTTF